MQIRNVLLLTATIKPLAGIPNLKRIDPHVRLIDYRSALKFYLGALGGWCDAIVFAENSNSEILELQKLVGHSSIRKKVEFIRFDGLDYPPKYDRGYGEFKLIDHAMKNASLLADQPQRTVVWKVTGRYIVKNIHRVVATQPRTFDVYCNYRNFPKVWVDTYLIAWTPSAYEKHLRLAYEQLKLNVPGVHPKAAAEELLRTWLDLQAGANIVKRFRVTPFVDSVRAADNKSCSGNGLWKFYLRRTLNTVLPSAWI